MADGHIKSFPAVGCWVRRSDVQLEGAAHLSGQWAPFLLTRRGVCRTRRGHARPHGTHELVQERSPEPGRAPVCPPQQAMADKGYNVVGLEKKI